ncbi:helix-turn-helix transcriptional regulator [Chryseobacterium wangxinyae]|uniref:helix-turn-helix domain-containing protein n=1 Tax=Chryseobacterium sp. CY350 TaxID=2997336 RepID=UPI00226F9ABF|nr:helix-turn-helix transcriptional regulator [Chryseobacterium sp. CY350]MCY0976865.1 helix-turn-helix transcriptional regulator [Chryseobacterium sp. CY350]WBZ96864.1 helix-turn-helix transcriptional regulator [Chryseobacterium sp. CY350]
MNKIFIFETTHFDHDFINHVKNLRQQKRWSQEELSIRMGVTKTFVGNVESYTQRHKYSTRHIVLLAKAFGYTNVSELMDFPTPEYDRIKVTVKKIYNECETKIMDSEILKIEDITNNKNLKQ